MKNRDNSIEGIYRRDGLVCLGRLFTNTEVENISRRFDDLSRELIDGIGVIRESNEKTIRSLMGWQRATGVLSAFASDQRILKPVKKILGENIEFHQTKYNSKSPSAVGGEKWDAHRGDTFWCLKDGIPDPHKILTVFVALTDQTKQNGAVFAWRGSHVVPLLDKRPILWYSLQSMNRADVDSLYHLYRRIGN
jgi:ectoine hydroxylase-related dioxygenase (phytanoyl-CoA dioxygenase family)